ncbi:GNAT family N-acetyltransferase [Telmatospirillum sp.]|uniref:GNAT family N-acetyltransferase n=1 Tax=Telmatospirillum sp. TaxID=2079197 RepID=UPI00284D5901|nr:GNAT family N-acetyltransferase [Telmatospirillum sp.]MDR3438623.1 GNAT family N-acetyltransferase [Telmatospirillum sp.]
MRTNSAVRVSWCLDPSEAPELARFFVDNVTPAYISHSELQGSRARDADHWTPELATIVARDIDERIRQAKGHPGTAENRQPVFTVRSADHLIGMGMASFFFDAAVPYAVLEDIVLASQSRNAGAGKLVLDWVTRQAEAIGCARVFLESGIRNRHAHDFFEREGFEVCSVVMMRTLSPKA